MHSRELRLGWFAVVVLTGLLGALFLTGGPGTGMDGRLLLDAGAALGQGGTPYADPKFLYSPLAALMAMPLAILPRVLVVDGWVVTEAVIAAAATWVLANPLPRSQRILAVVGVLMSLPVLWDLWLANVTIALVAALALALNGPDDPRRGIALGLGLAIVPKPLLVPALVWMAFFRQRALAGTMLVAGIATAIGLVVVGPSAYAAWIGALSEGTGTFARAFGGNWGLSAFGPAVWLATAIPDVLLLVSLCLRRDRATSLVVALMGGLIVSPYVPQYAVLVAMLALPTLIERWPRVTLAVGLVSPLAFALAPGFAAVLVTLAVAMRSLHASLELVPAPMETHV